LLVARILEKLIQFLPDVDLLALAKFLLLRLETEVAEQKTLKIFSGMLQYLSA